MKTYGYVCFGKKNKAKKNREIDFSKSISLLSYY